MLIFQNDNFHSYATIIGLDFANVIKVVNKIPKLYQP